MVKYFQPVTLTFVVALRSDGINNDHINSTIPVAKNDSDREFEAKKLENSSQIYTIKLDRSRLNTTGKYTISTYVVMFVGFY